MKNKTKRSKKCKECGRTKSLSKFYRHHRTKDGYASVCMECSPRGRPPIPEDRRKLEATETHDKEAQNEYNRFDFSQIKGTTKAEKCIYFLEHFCCHSRGELANKPLILEDWQKEIVREIFDGKYQKVFITMGRKNGKSLLVSGIALFLLLLDDEEGKEVYCAAGSRDQAHLIFDMISWMIKRNTQLSKSLKVIDSRHRIVYFATNSYIRAISSESQGALGFNSYAVIADEVLAWPSRELWDTLKTSFGARKNPLMIGLSTAGWDKLSLCYDLYRQGKAGIEPSFYFKCYELDEKDDWKEEGHPATKDTPATGWYKANPALGVFKSLDQVRIDFQEALQFPSSENSFKQFHLNMWTEQKTRWLSMDSWDKCDLGAIAEGKKRICYGGLDLASSIDIAAFVLVFEPVYGVYDILPYFFIPEESMRQRSLRDHVPYDVWVRQGLMTATAGNVIDFDYILSTIKGLSEKYTLKQVAYDRWGASKVSQELQAMNIEVIPFGQGFQSMASPSKELQRLILSTKLNHSGNPVLRWMAGNVAIENDAAGNIKPTKEKSTEKIDGIVALIMALDRALRYEKKVSVYDTRGVLVF